ncbi:hypothetical protein [Terrarubrum flagellatum]
MDIAEIAKWRDLAIEMERIDHEIHYRQTLAAVNNAMAKLFKNR